MWPDGHPAPAFLVAWSGMAGQSAKLLGLLKLSLDLKRMGVKRWETFAFWAWLFVGLGESPFCVVRRYSPTFALQSPCLYLTLLALVLSSASCLFTFYLII
jgi:hypothetical protein